jgi:hypothetical protein
MGWLELACHAFCLITALYGAPLNHETHTFLFFVFLCVSRFNTANMKAPALYNRFIPNPYLLTTYDSLPMTLNGL